METNKDIQWKRTRNELKKYFGAGQKPTSENFAELIDSMVNIVDDQVEGKIELVSADEHDAAIAFKKKSLDSKPVWTMAVDKSGVLSVRNGADASTVLSFYPDKRIELGDGADIVVKGKLHADAFLGHAKGRNHFPADGQWHELLDGSKGGKAYEITAGCEVGHSFGFLFVKAIATQWDNEPIRVVVTNYSWRTFFNNRIQVKWFKESGRCVLKIRTRKKYGDEVLLKVTLQELFY